MKESDLFIVFPLGGPDCRICHIPTGIQVEGDTEAEAKEILSKRLEALEKMPNGK